MEESLKRSDDLELFIEVAPSHFRCRDVSGMKELHFFIFAKKHEKRKDLSPAMKSISIGAL